MQPQNDVTDKRSLTPLDNLIGVFILIIELIFFISAPVTGMILVALALTIIVLLRSTLHPPGSGDTSLLTIYLCTPPIGILLGFYAFKRINRKIDRGQRQKNLVLAIKSGAGMAGLVFITSSFTIRLQDYLDSLVIACVASLISSVFVGRFIYRYLNRLSA